MGKIANRIWKIERRNDRQSSTSVEAERNTALLAIEEVLRAPDTRTKEAPSPNHDVRRLGLSLPRQVPRPEQISRPATRRARRFRLKKRFAIVVLAFGLAVSIGLLAGSTVSSSNEQPGSAGAYGISEVPGHPGGGY